MTKRLLTLLLIIFVLILPAGCGERPLPPDTRQETAPVEPETAPPHLPEFPAEATYRLTCLNADGMINDVVAVGHSTAAVVAVPYSEWMGGEPVEGDPSGFEEPPHQLYLVDLVEDRVISQTEIPANYDLLGVRGSGGYVFRDFSTDKIIVASPDGETVRSFDFGNGIAEYSAKTDLITACDADRVLFTVDPDTGEKTDLYAAPWGTDFSSFDAHNGYAAVTATAANEGTGCKIKLISTSDGSVRDLPYEENALTFFMKDALAMMSSTSVTDDEGQYLRTENDICVVPLTGGEPYGFSLPDDTALQHYAPSRYAIGTSTEYFEEGTETFYEDRYKLFDLEKGRMSEDIAEFSGALFLTSDQLEGSGRIAVGVSYNPDERKTVGRGADLYVIDPEMIETPVILERIDLGAGDPDANTKFTLSDAFAAQSRRRDEIERKYGVTIMLGDEVYNAAPNNYYSRVSFEDASAGYTQAELALLIDTALDTVDRDLSKYPDGFFDTFVNPFGEGGLRILIVEQLNNESGGSFSAGGVSYRQGAWYTSEICLNELQGYGATVHHELWHTVEQRILDEIPDAFNPDDWSRFNPEGFDYQANFEDYFDPELFRYIIWNWDSYPADEICFAQSYSTVTDKEDKATLIELIMDDATDDEFYGGYPTAYEWVTSFPRLKGKLEIMEKYTAEVFGSVYWKP